MLKIVITKASGDWRYLKYAPWLSAFADGVEYVDLSIVPDRDIKEAVSSADGIVFAGGEDIHPRHYGKADQHKRCHSDDMRDVRELAALELALEKRIPTLGVCRGAQLINVFHGGNLIIDLPTDRPGDVDHVRVTEDKWHGVTVEGSSVLRAISTELINSAHHQAVDVLADGFKITAKASDGIVEAFELIDPSTHSFLHAVQWHPERMPYDSPLSSDVANAFLKAASMRRS